MDSQIRKLYREMVFSRNTLFDHIESELENDSIFWQFATMLCLSVFVIGFCLGSTTSIMNGLNRILGGFIRPICGLLAGSLPVFGLYKIAGWFILRKCHKKVSQFNILDGSQMAELISYREECLKAREKEVTDQEEKTYQILSDGLELADKIICRYNQRPEDKLAQLYAKQAEQAITRLQEMKTSLALSAKICKKQLTTSRSQLELLRNCYREALEAREVRNLVQLEARAEEEAALLENTFISFIVSEQAAYLAMNELLTNAKSHANACVELQYNPQADLLVATTSNG
jgi:hypothetical protein